MDRAPHDKEGDSDEEENGSGDYYDVIFSEEKGEIELCAKFKIEAPSFGTRFLKGIKKGIGSVWKFILFLTGARISDIRRSFPYMTL